MRLKLISTVNDLKAILHPGGQVETPVIESTILGVECPFEWGFIEMKEKPSFLDSLQNKTFHLVGEGYLRPFLLRLAMTVETMARGQVMIAIRQFELAVGLLLNGLERDHIFGELEVVAMHVLFATASRIFLLRGYFVEALGLLRVIKIKSLGKRELAIVSCMKAIICAYYGMEGKMAALEHAVDARGSSLLEVEWRFVFVQVIPALYDINLTELVVRTSVHHTQISWASERNKPTTTFAHFYRLTYRSKRKRDALLKIRYALNQVATNSTFDRKTLDLQVIRALEVDPVNCELLNLSAFYFLITSEMHKSLTLFWIGRTMYRSCAVGLYDTLAQVYPLSTYLETEEILRYYSVEGGLPILKRASIFLLGSDRCHALDLAGRAIKIEAVNAATGNAQLLVADPPVEVGGQQASFGYYEVMGCVAYSLQGSIAADTYVDLMDHLLHPSIHPGFSGPVRRSIVLLELDHLLRLDYRPKIPILQILPSFLS